nr:hypothetical protein [Anaerolineae bacterium]
MTSDNQPTTRSSELSALLAYALFAHDEEQHAILAVLQEDLGQTLTALTLHLRLAQTLCEDADCVTQITESRKLASAALKSIEGLVHDLQPPALHQQGLGPAAEVFAREYARTTQIHTEIDFEILPVRPTPQIELSLFRIVQEALQNVHQYSHAESVQIVLRQIEDTLCLIIADDGGGYAQELLSSWDFLRIFYRAEALGGTAHLESLSGNSTRLVVRLPFRTREIQ